MTLEEALNQIDHLADDEVIFAKRPWRAVTEAQIGRLDENFGVPESLTGLNYEYFIDVPIAREVLGVLGSKRHSVQQRNELLLYYAEHDAYPNWVYQI
jgi:hypothetical protein